MRYLTLGEVVALHRAVIEKTGGMAGIRDLGALDSALAQPRAAMVSRMLAVDFIRALARTFLGLRAIGRIKR